jgi:polysaccharide biosynthesis protein PslH
MTPLRCLWVTRFVPYPPFLGGDAAYTAGLIEALIRTGVEVTVLCNDNGGTLPRDAAAAEWVIVPFNGRGRTRSLFGRMPSVIYRFSTPQIQKALRTLLRKRHWDAVLIDNVAMTGALGLDHDAWAKVHAKLLVYVSHNHEEAIRKRLASSAPRRSLKRFALRLDAAKAVSIEHRLIGAADLVTVITHSDAELYRAYAPDKRYLVLTPGYDRPRVRSRVIDEQIPRRVVLLGSYGWFAKQLNLWRFLEVSAGPFAIAGIGIDIVGWTPDNFAARLRTSFKNVLVTGSVDRVEPFLARARMGIVAEDIGGGFKLKVLDYVFNRVPVLSLVGSVAGTPLVAGESILEFADLSRLVDGVISTIDDLARLNAVQAAAFDACEGRFAWADRGRALAEAVTDLRTSSGRP